MRFGSSGLQLPTATATVSGAWRKSQILTVAAKSQATLMHVELTGGKGKKRSGGGALANSGTTTLIDSTIAFTVPQGGGLDNAA